MIYIHNESTINDMSDKIKLNKQISINLEGEASIDTVEVYYMYYDEDEYPQVDEFWESIMDKDYEFQIEGSVNVELSINGIELNRDFDSDIDFVIKGDWKWKRRSSGYKVELEVYPDDVLYQFFTRDQLKSFVKDCIMKKNSKVEEIALKDIGDPPLDGRDFSQVTFEWLTHIE